MSLPSAPSGSGSGPIGNFRTGLARSNIQSHNEILPRLYLGDIHTARNKDEITRLGITDMITIEIKPLEAADLAPCVKRYLFINVMDHAKQDILSHLDTSYEFIDSALKEPTNKVYVHCVAGISRSASLVMAYVMKSCSMNYYQAYSLVKQKRRIVGPNEGFARQLALYHRMHYTIDIANLDYRRVVLDALVFEFRLVALSYYQIHTSRTSRTGASAVCISTTSNIVHLPMAAHKNLASRNNIGILFDQYYGKLHLQEVNKYPQVYAPRSAYRCTSCRAVAFYATSVIENKPTTSTTSSGSDTTPTVNSVSLRGLATKQPKSSTKDCPFVFIEPQPWMNKRILEREGNLECYKCKRKLGKFDWTSGETCSCEAHTALWNLNLFKIMKKKVDCSLL